MSIKNGNIQLRGKNIKENKDNLKKEIVLMTTSQYKRKILINPNKKMKDLIKCYFEIINQPNLYQDKNIIFLFNGNVIPYDSEKLIKDYVKNADEVTILIGDIDDKIDTTFLK